MLVDYDPETGTLGAPQTRFRPDDDLPGGRPERAAPRAGRWSGPG
jgi:hypothetical protein